MISLSFSRVSLADLLQIPPPDSAPKPAALHLYPHIHGSRALSSSSLPAVVSPGSLSGHTQRLGAAHLAAGGGLSAAHYKSCLQPQLYNLHNSPSLSKVSKIECHQS